MNKRPNQSIQTCSNSLQGSFLHHLTVIQGKFWIEQATDVVKHKRSFQWVNERIFILTVATLNSLANISYINYAINGWISDQINLLKRASIVCTARLYSILLSSKAKFALNKQLWTSNINVLFSEWIVRIFILTVATLNSLPTISYINNAINRWISDDINLFKRVSIVRTDCLYSILLSSKAKLA